MPNEHRLSASKTTRSGSTAGWFDVWSRRKLDPSRGALGAQLLAADGFDTSFGGIELEHWIPYVRHWLTELGATSGTSVCDVGCGAGAFVYESRRAGCRVEGIDQSSALVQIARDAMPDGNFTIADAADLPVAPPADIVVSFSVFQYFASLDYARHVLERMVAKARHAVAVLDIPDSARREEALSDRIASVGGAEAYAERYTGLDHVYYERAWIEDAMQSCGLIRVRTADQQLPAYENARFRFNAWGFRNLQQEPGVASPIG